MLDKAINIIPESIKILIVDRSNLDSQKITNLINKVGSFKSNFCTFKDLNEAISKLKTDEFNICFVVSDFKGETAFEFLKNIRHEKIKTPVIILSEIESKRSGIDFLRAGAADYLVKETLHTSDLERAILYALERKRILDKTIRLTERQMRAQKMRALGELAENITNELDNSIKEIESQISKIDKKAKKKLEYKDTT